jgi:hypothetical protein
MMWAILYTYRFLKKPFQQKKKNRDLDSEKQVVRRAVPSFGLLSSTP